jgi:hypothetical protein
MMDTNVKRGFGYGLLATLGMTLIMLTGTALQLSPMPAPVPIALARWALGALPMPALVILGMLAHFLYGGVAGSILAWLLKNRVNIWLGFGWGVLLWLGMELVFLPLLGWGLFGSAITPKIAVATLILHLIYGGILGWGLSWYYHNRAFAPMN